MRPHLESLLGPPVDHRTSIDWGDVERDLGSELPKDYKDFVSHYGAGSIDGFLSIFTPAGPTQWVDLLWRGRDHKDLFFKREEQHPPVAVFPVPGGLLACGQTDNGDILYWRTEGAPDQWTTVVYEGRGPESFEFAGSITAFLEAVLSRQIRVDVFPRDFPTAAPRFAAYK